MNQRPKKPEWADKPPSEWPAEVRQVILLNARVALRRTQAERKAKGA